MQIGVWHEVPHFARQDYIDHCFFSINQSLKRIDFSQRLSFVKFEHCQSMNTCLRHAARISVTYQYSHLQAWLIGMLLAC